MRVGMGSFFQCPEDGRDLVREASYWPVKQRSALSRPQCLQRNSGG